MKEWCQHQHEFIRCQENSPLRLRRGQCDLYHTSWEHYIGCDSNRSVTSTLREWLEEPICRTHHPTLHTGQGPKKKPLLEDHSEVTGFSCLLPCKESPPTCPSVLLSPSSTKEKQEQILHDSTVSQAHSICSNLHTVIQVKKLALSWCLSQSVKYIQAPSVQFPLIFSLTCLFTNLLQPRGRAVVKSTQAVWWGLWHSNGSYLGWNESFTAV